MLEHLPAFYFMALSYIIFLLSFLLFARELFKELDLLNTRSEERSTRITNLIYNSRDLLLAQINASNKNITTLPVLQKKNRLYKRSTVRKPRVNKKIFKKLKSQLKELS